MYTAGTSPTLFPSLRSSAVVHVILTRRTSALYITLVTVSSPLASWIRSLTQSCPPSPLPVRHPGRGPSASTVIHPAPPRTRCARKRRPVARRTPAAHAPGGRPRRPASIRSRRTAPPASGARERTGLTDANSTARPPRPPYGRRSVLAARAPAGTARRRRRPPPRRRSRERREAPGRTRPHFRAPHGSSPRRRSP